MNRFDMASISEDLVETEPSFWTASGSESISYPETGHAGCFELEDQSFWFRHRNACIGEAMRMFPPDGPLFDIGAGNGFVSAGLEALGFESIVVEPGADGARNAYSRGLRPVVHASMESAGFLPGSLSAVGLFDVVEHISDDVGFLAAVRTKLRPGGRVYLTVPAYRWLWSYEDVAAGHFRRHTKWTLTAVLDQAGLKSEFMSYVFWFLPLPILLARSLPSAFGRRKTGRSGSAQRQHVRPAKLGGKPLDKALAAEMAWLAKGRIPFGSSILAVATAE